MPGPEVKRKKKELVKIFKNNGLSITLKTNLKTADFLDIHFDLVTEIYQPFKKPNDDPLISSNKSIFEQSIPYQENALKKSGYNVTLKYTPTQNQDENNREREQRKRKIIWFDPPYSLNVKTGKLFFKLLDHNFRRAHKFHKIFNRNMENMGSIISSHNKQVLQFRNENYGSNCRKNESCSLDNKCLTPIIIYYAQITNNTNDEHKTYLGAAETSFKERYSNHL